jgi:hypothetical protein
MNEKESNIDAVRHMVGGKIGLAKMFYSGEGDRNLTEKNIQNLRDESIKYLEQWSKTEGDNNEDILKFLASLKDSDWSNRGSFLTFETKYNKYTEHVSEEIGNKIKELFKERNRLQ